MGQIEVTSWQITMQLFFFLALTLDAIAIAAQAMIGRALGSPHPARAVDSSTRLMEWGVGLGVVLMLVILPFARSVAAMFTDDPRVLDAAAPLVAWLALLQPLAGAAFTLDGILIGGSDVNFLATSMVASSILFVGLAIAALEFDWGTAGLAVSATVWIVTRTATTGARLVRRRWVRDLTA
jgi:Na+-driven multidrug efflux pump